MNAVLKILPKKQSFFIFSLALFLFLFSGKTAHAAETRAVTVLSANNSMGVVNCTLNGASFTHYTYTSEHDYITASALPMNTRYYFSHWTDNGIIVSKSSTYSFSPGNRDRVVIAHFAVKAEEKGHRHDTDDNIDSITPGTNPCTFAPGYRLDGMTINTALITPDTGSQSAAETLTSGSFCSAFRISFSYGYNGTPKESLDSTMHLRLSIPAASQKTGRYFRIVDATGPAPVMQEDLDDSDKTVTFPAKKGGVFFLACSDTPFVNTPVIPAVPITPETVIPAAPESILPAVPEAVAPAVPVTEEEYLQAVIILLRRQLQESGITPLV